jgi:hypothetical protein
VAGSETYISALAAAPGQVKLTGQTLISDCLTEEQAAGPIAQVGAAMIEAATALNGKARNGDDTAALQAGYLVGAAERGASQTAGIHAELVRRLNAAARFDAGKPLKAGFRQAFAKGYAPGRRDG